MKSRLSINSSVKGLGVLNLKNGLPAKKRLRVRVVFSFRHPRSGHGQIKTSLLK